MNPVISELIALDKEAQNMVSAAQEQREALRLQIKQEKQDLHQRYQTEYETTLRQRKAQIKAEHEALIAQMEQDFDQKSAMLEDLFDQNQASWAQQIAQHCMRS